MRISPSVLAVAGCVVVGGYLWIGGDEAPAQAERAATAQPAAIPAMAPRLPSVEGEPELEAEDDEKIEEAMRGLTPLEDPAELAFVFTVDGESYLQLSTEERAEERGSARMFEDDGVFAVVAPVTTAAMPAELRAWEGRSVLVDGVCRARVVGFAEVSRISGEPPAPSDEDSDGGSGEGSDEDGTEADDAPATWTIESVVDSGVVLAARLDDCAGTWARSTDYSPAAVAVKLEAPELEEAAREELLARKDVDPTQKEWAEAGGEGDWRDAAEVVTQVYQHPLTDERWVFAQARRFGGCGDPGFGMMAAYRANADGTLRRVADLEFGYDTLAGVMDVDGDGQPELMLGEGNGAELVDLANQRHASIGVEYRYTGCGC